MPAIQPARLKIQSAELAAQSNDPPAFVRRLYDLLEFYANRTYRPGQAGTPKPLTQTYNVPLPVMRQVMQDLAPRIAAAPAEMLPLCTALWQEPVLEFRQLAAEVLGRLPRELSQAGQALLTTWVRNNPDQQALASLLETSTQRQRKEQPDQVVQLTVSWLKSDALVLRRSGLWLIGVLAADADFANLPALYSLLTPLLRQPPSALRLDLITTLTILARRSPRETAHFFREILALPSNADTAWIIRRILPEFSPELQTSLRIALKG